jgi:hypothetical protein
MRQQTIKARHHVDGLIIISGIKRVKFEEILLLGFIMCKTLNYKASRTNLFEAGYYVMILMGVYKWS